MPAPKQKSIVLLHGVFDGAFLKELKNRNVKEVYLLEGRPSLRAAKKFSKVLLKNKIKPILIADNMAGFLFFRGLIKEVWISYQEADDQGTTSPIGGLILGVLGQEHKIPVNLYPSAENEKLLGQQKEIFYFDGKRVAPKNITGYVPLTERLPKKYITKIYE